MRFTLRLDGKDSIRRGIRESIAERLDGISLDEEDRATRFTRLEAKFVRFVHGFVERGRGGDDAVALEFDVERGTCRVVPITTKAKARK